MSMIGTDAPGSTMPLAAAEAIRHLPLRAIALAAVFVFAVPERTLTASTIVVTTASDANNGNVSSVAALLADPGPDGVSLREAISATNSDPGQYTIAFATALLIQLELALPPLRGGNVTIRGPATIRGGAPSVPTPFAWGFLIGSSGNRLSEITIEGFFLVGVHICQPPGPLSTRAIYRDNTVERVTIRGVQIGVDVGPFYNPACPSASACPTHNSYVNTMIVDNVIESSHFGIRLDLMSVSEDLLDGATLARNTIRLGTQSEPGKAAPIQIDVAGYSISSRIANVTIADNTIESVQAGGDGAIFIGSGLQRARRSVIEDVRVVGNRIRVERPGTFVPCCHGIVVDAGSDYFTFSDPGSPDDNVVRRVEVSDNDLAGALASGVRIQAGADGGGSRNRVEAVMVLQNKISSNIFGRGIYLWVGQIGEGRTVVGNSITDVAIDANVVTTGEGGPTADTGTTTAGGIVLIGGAEGGWDGSISNVRMTNNRITTSQAGIRVIGGRSWSSLASGGAQGNSVRDITIHSNTLVVDPSPAFSLGPIRTALQVDDEGAAAVSVAGGVDTALRNAVGEISVVNNTLVTRDAYGIRAVSNANGATDNTLGAIQVRNTIFASGGNDIGGELSGGEIGYSLLSGALLPGSSTNLVGDAQFVDEAHGDFRLLPASPAIDHGSAEGAPDTDIECRPRFGTPDIGAHEFGGAEVARLFLTVAGGKGTVSTDPRGFNCGAATSFLLGTMVQLRAAPGWRLLGWSGDADCMDGVVTMSSDRRCSATLVEMPRRRAVRH